MPDSSASPRERREGVIVLHPFGCYREAQFVDDPAEIERMVSEGGRWRITDAVLLATES